MKKIAFLFVLFFSFINATNHAQAEELNQTVIEDAQKEIVQVKLSEIFEDKEVAGIVLKELQKQNISIESLDEEFSIQELDKITRIHDYYHRKSIYSLGGVEYLKNLESISLKGTSIKDISPLFTLPKLYNISMTNSEIEDISNLVDFYTNGNEASIKYVNLNGSNIVDFSPLEKINDSMGRYDSLDLRYQSKIIEMTSPVTQLPMNVDLSFYKLHNGEKINVGYNEQGHFKDGLFVIESVSAFNNGLSIEFEREFHNIEYGADIRLNFQNNLLPTNLINNFQVKANSDFDFSSPFENIDSFINMHSYRVDKGDFDPTVPGLYTLKYTMAKSYAFSETKEENRVHFDVTVEVLPVKADSISIFPSINSVERGYTKPINITIKPFDTTEKEIIWEIADPSIASINEQGIVTGLRVGNTELTAKIKGTTLEAKTRINVFNKVTNIEYQSHVEKIGWQYVTGNGLTSGTIGQSKRLEGIRINTNMDENSGVTYQTHVESYGWRNWVKDGQFSGTEGEAKRLEAIKVKLTGEVARHYDVYYRVHAEHFGWLDWAKNGEPAGTSGFAYRLEAIEIKIVPDNEPAPGPSVDTFKKYRKPMQVKYRTHIESYGWQNRVADGKSSGTVGQSKRLEAIQMGVDNALYPGGISYQTHVESHGWIDWSSNEQINGTVGEAKRLEAIRIKLTGQLSEYYDIYYRVHAQHYGWLDWAKNGDSAGTSGYKYRLESIQIQLVKKGV
ncbi:Ig-like domain-containing protein [Marinilactibacillus piezotolerans]|uniref:Ig-like domain-containing protein n=1 Tax=Marinilactibacillus piezotolerans TaxID=258723 RepID=UPI0009B022D8|nr:Ig-like domain-containing protein [Marinilactibacillus piezotolerans]